jgi:hypothetical protein
LDNQVNRAKQDPWDPLVLSAKLDHLDCLELRDNRDNPGYLDRVREENRDNKVHPDKLELQEQPANRVRMVNQARQVR